MPLPTVKAEEVELVDPYTTLREECSQKPKCQELKAKWDECEARVNSRKKTTEICSEELIDFFHCVDFCAAPQLFKHLK